MTQESHETSSATKSTLEPQTSRLQRFWSRLELVLSLILAVGVLCYILWTPPQNLSNQVRVRPPEVVKVTGPNAIQIVLDSPLSKKLQVVQLQSAEITAPMLTVTGTVVASMRPGKESTANFWQFNTPDLLTNYTDWQKALADIAFLRVQLVEIRELALARIDAQNKVVERMKKTVEGGTNAEKDLAKEKAGLLELQLESKKADYQAETAVKVAERTAAALSLQLQQSGLEPEFLQSATAEMDIVLAEVPEGQLGRVQTGQKCIARFFGIPQESFTGEVSSIAPVLTAERRTLRAMFVVLDPDDLLRPGMFAEIGIGTEPHLAILMPAEGVLHIGRGDYAVVQEANDRWRVAEIRCGELYSPDIEILDGLQHGNHVIGDGAILLKPVLIRALQAPHATSVHPTPFSNTSQRQSP